MILQILVALWSLLKWVVLTEEQAEGDPMNSNRPRPLLDFLQALFGPKPAPAPVVPAPVNPSPVNPSPVAPVSPLAPLVPGQSHPLLTLLDEALQSSVPVIEQIASNPQAIAAIESSLSLIPGAGPPIAILAQLANVFRAIQAAAPTTPTANPATAGS